jgi:parvulin-like peptidyl-prolyl isomerase
MPRSRVASLALLALVAAAAIAAGCRGARPVPSGPAVARVNDAVITERDLDVRISELLPMASFHGNMPADRRLALSRAALDELIFEELVWQEAARAGRRPDAAGVEAEIARVRQRFPSEAEFRAGLAASRVSEQEFRGYMERAVLMRTARARHVPPAPTAGEVETYYAENRAKFRRPEQVHLYEIHVRIDPSGGRAAERDARRRLAAIERRLAAGEAFGAVAWDASEDGYRVKSGELGWVHRGRLDPDLEAAVFAAPVGKTGLARSLAGFHVFVVRAREAERQLGFEDARAEIVQRLTRDRAARALADWQAGLTAAASITIVRDDLRRATPLEIRADGVSPTGPSARVQHQ